MKKIFFLILVLFMCTCTCYAASTCTGVSFFESKFLKEYENSENTIQAEFKLYNYKKEYLADFYNENNLYNLAPSKAGYQSFITDSQNAWIDSISSIQDIIDYYETSKYTYNRANRESYLESIKNSDGIEIIGVEEERELADVIINSFGIVEETKVPSGYQKSTFVTPFYFRFNYSKGELIPVEYHPYSFYNFSSGGCGERRYTTYLVKYSDSIDYSNFYEVIKNMDNSYVYGNNCNLNFTLGNVFGYEDNAFNYQLDGTCRSLVVNEKGVPVIEVEGTLNNQETLSIEEDTVASYKLNVKNNSNVPSNNNIIKSKIPKGVTYVEGSANNNGIFDSDTNTVTWNIEYIDTNESIELSYEVRIINNDKTYHFITSIENDENDEIPTVTNTVNTSTVKNPKTGNIIPAIIILCLIISLLVFNISYNKKIIKNVN